MKVKVSGNRSPGQRVSVIIEMDEWEADEIVDMLEATLEKAARDGKDVELDNESTVGMYLALRFRPKVPPRTEVKVKAAADSKGRARTAAKKIGGY